MDSRDYGHVMDAAGARRHLREVEGRERGYDPGQYSWAVQRAVAQRDPLTGTSTS